MIDQLLGRPSPSLRRTQVFIVLFFWIWRLYKGDGAPRPFPSRTQSAVAPGPSGLRGKKVGGKAGRSWIWRLWIQLVGKRAVVWMGKLNERLKNFSPYQLILATLTLVYALRHFDDLLGISAPEPLARMYTRSYYRATYVNTAFDAGFSIAMNIRPKWLKDICSMLFSAYYLAYASEGDEVLRRFRAVCSVEMLRTTWEKTKNPYIRLITSRHRVRLPVVRTVTIARPPNSSRSSLPPVKAMLFFSGSEEELASATELIVDFPGGGFIAMGPECHEERLRIWAKRTGKPVLGVDYGKAPEYPYPWAIEEGFDAYRTLMETKGEVIGITSGKLGIVLTGDSAGGNLCATIMLRILEHPTGIPKPVSMILAYPALDFNFTSWMSPQNLRVLRTEQSETQIPGLVHGKDHMRHKAPLSVVDDLDNRSRKGGASKQKSWAKTLSDKLPLKEEDTHDEDEEEDVQKFGWDQRRDAEKSLAERVKTPLEEKRFEFTRLDSPVPLEQKEEQGKQMDEMVEKKRRKAPIGTRLTMTSRVGYFQDRIISPSMMRAMAILYIGPARNPDFETDYYISPILTPSHLLAHFPPVYFISGERDPFVDDTIIFSGKIREAKRARKAQAEIAALSNPFKHGEMLRMSSGKHGGKSSSGKMDIPDPILSELDDDWVQMRIIEGWGHGFMQMSSLMREVDPVLMEMADWIDESFEKAKEKQRDLENLQAARVAIPASPLSEDGSRTPVETALFNNSITAHSVHIKPSREYGDATPGQASKGGDLGTAFAGDAEADDGKDNMVTFTPKTKKRIPPPSNFHTVPRRPSKESLTALQRSPSAPRFDADETGSSGEAMTIQTPPLVNSTKRFLSVQGTPRGSGAFAFFGSGKSEPSSKPRSGRISPTLFGVPRISPSPAGISSAPVPESNTSKITRPPLSGAASASNKPKNSLVAAAVASARAASPALAAAGFAPQSVGNVSEAELLRRRRMEAVYGIGETNDGIGNEVKK
ncbi:hormone-sensitive lipase [Cryptococcus gattii Ru294]|nr:hormone-sensitive lipase [Cryptococcus gattii Ru294]